MLIANLMLLACPDEGGDTDSGGDDTGTQGACVPDDVLAVLSDFDVDLFAGGGQLAEESSATNAVGFLAVPGFGVGMGSTVFSLIAECDTAKTYDPYCEDNTCTRIECTGAPGIWITHFTLDPLPYTEGEWTFDAASVDCEWNGVDGEFGSRIAGSATGPDGRDWTYAGTGGYTGTTYAHEVEFPSLLEAGSATLSYSTELGSQGSGALVVGGTTVATGSATGKLSSTGECP